MKFSAFRAHTTSIGILCVASIALVGCDSKTSSTSPNGSGTKQPSSTLVGNIKINGSSTVLPITNAIRETFIQSHPDVDIQVDGTGTGNGFRDFYAKSTDISDASRPIKPGELEKCKNAGVEFVELPVAYDGLTIVVHPENDWVKTLTIEQLRKMFVGENHAKKWKDVDESWPDEDIKFYAPGTGSGTYDYFREVVTMGEEANLHQDMNLNEDDNILVQGVSGNKYSIGFFGVAYYEANRSSLKAVEIINPKDGTAYLPTTENIAANKYAPFSRPLFIYVNIQSLDRAEVQTFVDYFLENVSDACEKVDYVRLPDELYAAAKANLENLATGTHFVDAEGSSRSGALADNFVADNLTE